MHFSPFQNAELGMDIFDRVFAPPFAFSYMDISMITSQGILFDLDLVWLCMYGIQFPTDPMMDHFLSSVISMVAPTWCHGPIGGNPLWETVD